MRRRIFPCLPLLLLMSGVAAPLAAEEPAPAPADPVVAALLDPPATGLLVLEVVPGGVAADLRLARGTILLSYDGQETPTPEALKAAVQAAGDRKDVLLTVRAPSGATETHVVPAGRLGVALRAVAKGQGVSPLPPDTRPPLDAKRLLGALGETWYKLLIESSGTRGYERHRVERGAGGSVVLHYEVAFDGGERWGRMHSLVRVTLGDEGTDVRFENVLDGGVAETSLRSAPEGGTTVRFARPAPGAASEGVSRTLPAGPRLVPTFLVESLATLMPAEKGATLRYRPFVEATGEVRLEAALTVTGRETIPVDGASKEVWRVEAKGLGDAEGVVFWVAEGRVWAADYGDAVTATASREAALEGVAADLAPR